MFARKISTQIEIDAPAEVVWDVLTDFERMPEWNPFLKVSGQAEEGSRLEVHAPGFTFRPTVLEASKNRRLRWLGSLVIPGLFDGEHSFTIEPVGENGVRFTQAESFSGLLVPALSVVIKGTEKNFVKMNEALKKRAEEMTRGNKKRWHED